MPDDEVTVTIEVSGKPIELRLQIQSVSPRLWRAVTILPVPARALAAEGHGATREQAIEDVKRLAVDRLLAEIWLP